MLATRSPSFLHLVHDQRCYLSEHRSWAPRRQQFLSAPSISPYPPSPAFSKVNHLLRTCCSSPTAALSPGVTVLPFSSCLLNNTPGSWEHLKCGTPHEHDWACFFRPTAWLPEQPFSSQGPDCRKEVRAEARAFMASFLGFFFLDPQDHDTNEVLLPDFIIPKYQLLSSCGLQWVLLCSLIYGPSSLLVLQWIAQSSSGC